jgi:hypothetical protein
MLNVLSFSLQQGFLGVFYENNFVHVNFAFKEKSAASFWCQVSAQFQDVYFSTFKTNRKLSPILGATTLSTTTFSITTVSLPIKNGDTSHNGMQYGSVECLC